ncbi:hypothetical protein PX554_22400 [Sphingomonas sp. H39-1-10]|uniref:hypothetical protein n=1 Tax=Sphingomonas TaxID=13687 RepID=UPI00087F681B|nr:MULTISPECIES: hypothetical protein [Sphingomonas]MDF0490886.1 hypothetical protein [Sphingomonas pollutisoli]SDA21810.1 hypothetical protein SAMN03159340_01501 [Sphingomonas sp. NFR15]
MSNPVATLLALLALAPAAAADRPRDAPIERIEMAQLTFHSRIVIRIPRMTDPHGSRERPDRPVRLEEKRGPKCVPLTTLDRAVITGSDSIDLLLETGERIRARFDDDCPALDFYPDLYLRLPDDGLLCAGRDAIRSRSGGVCPIETFRRLVERR